MELILKIVADNTIKEALLHKLMDVAEAQGISPDEAAAAALEEYIERETKISPVQEDTECPSGKEDDMPEVLPRVAVAAGEK